ncbi:3,4-dihydroxy-2-butanone-4-phosphate synthase [Niallia alba]|uniref:3,4-dihydroxy-2-butanone-4-phosphate synthase n=1 Tax=Niallia alba TaxID=2729105 RepID=UPI0039A3BDBF
MFDSIEDALTDLKKGKVVIVCDDEDRENEGDFIGLADHVSPEMINFMAKEGRGLICVPIPQNLATKLDLPPMVTSSSDPRKTAFTISIDHKETSTGISAHERAFTISKMVDSNAIADDFTRPGHIFPLIAKDGGVLKRNGHTEAAVDLAILAGATPIGIICEILKEDGTMARVNDLHLLAKKWALKMITIQDLIQYKKSLLQEVE